MARIVFYLQCKNVNFIQKHIISIPKSYFLKGKVQPQEFSNQEKTSQGDQWNFSESDHSPPILLNRQEYDQSLCFHQRISPFKMKSKLQVTEKVTSGNQSLERVFIAKYSKHNFPTEKNGLRIYSLIWLLFGKTNRHLSGHTNSSVLK